MMGDKLLPEIKDGFSFSCQQCGRCCCGLGEGFVFLYDKELLKIAKKLGISVQECVTKYVDVINSEYTILNKNLKRTKRKVFLKSLILRQNETDGSCVLLDLGTNLCTIYEARPAQCKSWPTWYPLMTSAKELRDAKEKCPGFQSKNGFISYYDILLNIENELKNEYHYVTKMKRHGNDLRKMYRFLKDIEFKHDIVV